MAGGEYSPQVTAAFALLEATDPGAAYHARLALRSIIGDRVDPAALTVRAVQDFCWHELPVEGPG